MISSTNSVSIHFRRGDYLTNPSVMDLGICELEYYYKCVDNLAKIVPDPHFFILSDDPEWVTNNIKINYPKTIICINLNNNDSEDLRLMSLCKHNIIANSSFSWWGAWLNSNPDKLVFAPKKWFNKTDRTAEKLIPDTWITV
jgi:hypothetical protein